LRDLEDLPFWNVRVTALNKANSMIGTILLVLLILMILGAFPTWPHSRNWGYYPSSGLGLILIVVIALMVMGRI